MEILQNTHGNEESPSSHDSCQGSFKQHLESMGIFRRSHEFTEHNGCSKALGTPHAKIEPVAPEFHKLLPTLLIIGYILNLIHERGTVILPRNWQN